MSKHMRFKWLRSKSIQILRKCHKFWKKAYSGIFPFVYEGKEDIHKYMKHAVFMTVCMGRIANEIS